MVTKKDVSELKRRLTKNDCTFTKMCGCYVNADGEKVTKISETFLNIEDAEFFKYLEIAKKTISGSLGNNLLELEFPLDEESAGGKQQYLMALKESGLKNEDLLDGFYDRVIESYDYVGNYLILIFHDAYDVIVKGSDNAKQDESEEVYEYLLCAICPVNLSKPGLGYKENENRIGARERDWVVENPVNGFLFPAFAERSSDIHSIVYYTKDAKSKHDEFVESFFGCESKMTVTEKKETFQSIVEESVNDIEADTEMAMLEIEEQLQVLQEDYSDEEVVLQKQNLTECLDNTALSPDIKEKIVEIFDEEFADTPLKVSELVNEKEIEKKKCQQFSEQIKSYDVVLHTNQEKAKKIHRRVIDGMEYLIVPIKKDDSITVNGMHLNNGE